MPRPESRGTHLLHLLERGGKSPRRKYRDKSPSGWLLHCLLIMILKSIWSVWAAVNPFLTKFSRLSLTPAVSLRVLF